MKIGYWIFIVVFCVGGIFSFLFWKNSSLSHSSPPFFFQEIIPSLVAQPKRVTIAVTGDVIPARSVNTQTRKRNDFTWAWQNISPLLKNADITVVNLETPLMKNCQPTDSGMQFCGDVRHIEGLASAGTDVVTIANNHAGNYGIEGMNETQELLQEKGIGVAGGSDQPMYKTVEGMQFAFLAYNSIGYEENGMAWVEEARITQDIQKAKKQSDIVIISVHWGEEYTASPTPFQIALAHSMIDAGADLVLGNHPHWVQAPEVYKGKYITYAHGNTIFDQMWSEETKVGVLGFYAFENKKLASVSFIPTYIQSYGQPMIMDESHPAYRFVSPFLLTAKTIQK